MSDVSNGFKKRTYFITGGGTGGHIYPALAVCEELSKDINVDLYYIGNPSNLEYDVVTRKGYKFLPVDVFGMPRRLSFKFIHWGINLFVSWIKCLGYIRKYKPDAVLGTGGYVSAPILLACKCFKNNVPYMIHDCDLKPGLVSRLVEQNANMVSLAFEGAKQFINNPNYMVNGNPIREEFKYVLKTDARKNLGLEDKITICIMGGSQGAKSINDSAVELLRELSCEMNVQVIFQTGKRNYNEVIDRLSKIYPHFKEDKNIVIRPYFEDMITVLKASDIAISRAGSLSISELCASSVCSIFVPYPYAAADHQRKNAMYMVEKKAGLYIEDSEINPNVLMSNLKKLLNNKEFFENVKLNVESLAKLDATQVITQELIRVANEKL